MHIQGPVCLTAVQIDGDRDNGHVGKAQDNQNQLPPGKVE
jgi:hypothetical protein